MTGAVWTSVAFYYLQPPVPGDVDADGDLDLRDAAGYVNCFNDPAGACVETYDVDESGAVDLPDWGLLAAALTGAW